MFIYRYQMYCSVFERLCKSMMWGCLCRPSKEPCHED